MTPYVLTSEYPEADDQSVPWWWAVPGNVADARLRLRATRLLAGDTSHDVRTIDHGQCVWYAVTSR